MAVTFCISSPSSSSSWTVFFRCALSESILWVRREPVLLEQLLDAATSRAPTSKAARRRPRPDATTAANRVVIRFQKLMAEPPPIDTSAGQPDLSDREDDASSSDSDSQADGATGGAKRGPKKRRANADLISGPSDSQLVRGQRVRRPPQASSPTADEVRVSCEENRVATEKGEFSLVQLRWPISARNCKQKRAGWC